MTTTALVTDASPTPDSPALREALFALFENLFDQYSASANDDAVEPHTYSNGARSYGISADECPRDWFFTPKSLLDDLHSAWENLHFDFNDKHDETNAALRAFFGTEDNPFTSATVLCDLQHATGDGDEHEAALGNLEQGWYLLASGTIGEYSDEDADIYGHFAVVRGTPAQVTASLQSTITGTVVTVLTRAKELIDSVPEAFRADALQAARQELASPDAATA